MLGSVSQLADLVMQFLVLSELFWGGLFQISLGLLTELSYGNAQTYFVSLYSMKNVGVGWKIQGC